MRNLRAFNLAPLLAKQGWRILENPDSMVANVLKHKYFPRSDLLSAPKLKNASFVWKNISSALFILRRGATFDFLSNKFVWSLSADGVFSTKSAYSLVEELNLGSNIHIEQSTRIHLVDFWKNLWKVGVPKKIKIFIWKAFHNGLHVGWELQRRLGVHDSRCKICGCKMETSIHLFKDC